MLIFHVSTECVIRDSTAVSECEIHVLPHVDTIKDGHLTIGNTRVKVSKNSLQSTALVPEVLFYDNPMVSEFVSVDFMT